MNLNEATGNMEAVEELGSKETAAVVDEMESAKALHETDPADALRFHIGKVLEAIEASTAYQKRNGKPPAPPPRTLQMHLPPDAQQVLVFVIAGNGNTTTAALDADPEQTEATAKDARVRIVEQQGEGNTSTVLVIDEWNTSERHDSEIVDEQKETVVIDISGQGGMSSETSNEEFSDDSEEVDDDDSERDVSPIPVDSDDDDWVPESSTRSGKRALPNTSSNGPAAKRGRVSSSPVKCDKCGVEFASDSAFKYHPCEQKTEESHFICKFCGKEYNDPNVFWDHYREHAGMKRARPNKCAQCSRTFETPELLQEHCTEKKHASEIQCTLCEGKFSSKNQIVKHKRLVHHQKHSCLKCQDAFLTKEELITHRLAAHSIAHECSECNEKFANRHSLLKHMRDTHPQAMHTCAFCEKMFLRQAAMLTHQAQHLGPANPGEKAQSATEQDVVDGDGEDEEGKSYVCEKCGHAFPTQLAFQKHSITHSNRLYPCSKCSIVMRTEEDLLRHQQRHEVKLICDKCGRQYTQLRDLQKHMTTHSDTRPFPCATCGFRFFSEDRLVKHQRVHQEKRFLCNLCPRKFTDNEHLRRHLHSHASTKRQRINACVFHCLMCTETFESPTRLIQHYDTSHPLAEFRCVECDVRVLNFSSLKSHFRGKHRGKVIHCCRVCGDSFLSKNVLETHRSTDHNVPRRQQIIAETKVACTVCEKTFNSPKLYQEHLKTSENCKEAAAIVTTEPEQTPFKCTICEEEFPTNSHFVTHNTVHGTEFPVSCHICGADLADVAQVNDHLNQHVAVGIWSCLECNRALSTRQSLRMHMAGHGTVAPFTCPTCHKNFNWRSALAWHMNVHTGQQPFKCKRCDASFKQPNQLKSHLLAHDGRKMYECSECGKAFWLRSALIGHLSNHVVEEQGGDKGPAPTHDCNICGKVFNAKSYLANHLRTHKGEKGLMKKQFACERCKRTFTTRAHLIIHERIHDGAGLVCPVCQRKFKTLNWLQIHMRIHTSESPVCPICNKSFTIQRSLEEHMVQHAEPAGKVICPTCNTKFKSERSYLRHKGKCLEGFDGQVCRVCGLGFTTAEKYNAHALVCDIKQNRRTTENAESDTRLVKVEQLAEEEAVTQEQVVVLSTDEAISVSEILPEAMANAPDAVFIPDDGSQFLLQNVLEAIEGEKFVVSNSEGTVELDQLIEGQMPTELLLDGPTGKVRVQLVFQTMG